jgi:hypothetical protein
MIRHSSQKWVVGQQVKCGFMTGLTVCEAKQTPGDYLPDAYLLEKNGKFYEFVPHNGIKGVSLDHVCKHWGQS